ncbi:MAG TPA: hypothetical protein DCW29_12995, partial [Janthinobacterium sp.]|nr:hypothetical protein [Janthinobacterium sp.]
RELAGRFDVDRVIQGDGGRGVGPRGGHGWDGGVGGAAAGRQGQRQGRGGQGQRPSSHCFCQGLCQNSGSCRRNACLLNGWCGKHVSPGG